MAKLKVDEYSRRIQTRSQFFNKLEYKDTYISRSKKFNLNDLLREKEIELKKIAFQIQLAKT